MRGRLFDAGPRQLRSAGRCRIIWRQSQSLGVHNVRVSVALGVLSPGTACRWRLTTYLPLRSFSTTTTDISDAHADISVAESIFRDYGGVTSFHGPISTIKCFENNPLVRSTLETAGNGTIRRKPASFILRERDRGVGYAGRVLVVDGGGSLRCALLGGNLAEHRSSCTPVRRVGRLAPTLSALFSHPTSLRKSSRLRTVGRE